MQPRKPIHPTNILMFKHGNRGVKIKIPSSKKLQNLAVARAIDKGIVRAGVESIKLPYLYALKGLKSAFPEIPDKKIKGLRIKICEIIETGAQKTDLANVLTRVNELGITLAKELTPEQGDFYKELLDQLERHFYY